MDWQITGKDATIATGVLAILLGGYRRVWCWYYQLEDAQRHAKELLAEQQESADREIAALRSELTKAEKREGEWKDLAWKRREIVSQAIELASTKSNGETERK